MLTAQQIIEQYQLQSHPEGGWYKETYSSNENIPAAALRQQFGGERSFSTAIYFLLEQGNFSAFHRIKSDECWHFYAGETLQVFVFQHSGQLETVTLGSKIGKGECFQYVVPANCWFASRIAHKSAYAFVGCTVAPCFDFADFELADKVMLANLYPQHANHIKELCRVNFFR